MKSVTNRWGRTVRVGSFVTANHPRGGEISGTVKSLRRMSGYGVRAELDSGYSISVDDVKTSRGKRSPKGAKIVFQPRKEIRGEMLTFSSRLYAKQIPGRKGWFIHGHERTGNYYGGNYVTLVAWPNYPVNNRVRSGFNRAAPGWRTKAEADRAVKLLTRFVRMKGLAK